MDSSSLFVRLAILAVALYAVLLPLGYLYRGGKVRPWVVGLVGLPAGVALALIIAAPDFEPLAATIAAAVIAGFGFAVGGYLALRIYAALRNRE